MKIFLKIFLVLACLCAQAQVPIYTRPAGTSIDLTSPGPIGGTTPAAGTFTPLTVGAAGSQAILQGDAANTLALRNSTNAQCLRTYNTFTDASNGEWGQFCWSANQLNIGTVANGTGSSRSINFNIPGSSGSFIFNTNGGTKWTIPQLGGLTPGADVSYDIGVAATRLRNIYVGNGVIYPAPLTNASASYTVLATDLNLITNVAGTTTLTLPTASTNTGKTYRVKTITAQLVISASSNVVPLAGGAAGTAILAATAGKWADLTSDGTNWVIMAGN